MMVIKTNQLDWNICIDQDVKHMRKGFNPEEEIVNTHEDGQEEEKISAYRLQAPQHDPWDRTWERKNLRLRKGRRVSGVKLLKM